MKNTTGKLMLTVGLAMLVYTGYQAMTYRESLRLTQQEFVGLPPSLLSLLAAAVAVSLLGGLQSSGELKPISLADAPQATVLRPQQIDFVTFDGRGSLLTALKARSRNNGPAVSEQTSSIERFKVILLSYRRTCSLNMAPIRIGVLALQGSFREHMTLLSRIPGVEAVEVRTVEQLRSVSGLIIPGGESTTMALVAEKWGLIPELQSFAAARHPIWGTCAGLIFLANRATGMKEGGQALLGGLDCLVHRNFFGAQINSFETMLPAPACLPSDGVHEGPFRAVFIRAPSITETGPGVEILAEYTLSPEEKAAQGRDSVAVAVRSGNLLATAFHPELTEDARWHAMFVEMVKENLGTANTAENGNGIAAVDVEKLGRAPTRPADLPVY